MKVAVVELGVLVALAVLLVLAITVGPSNGTDADPVLDVAPSEDQQEADVDASRDTSGAPTSRTRSTTATTSREEALAEDDAEAPDAITIQIHSIAVDVGDEDAPTSETGDASTDPSSEIDETAAVATPATEYPEPELTASVNGPFATIDVTRQFACGLLTEGRVKCWGEDAVGQTEITDSQYSAIDAGSWAGCGLGGDGGIECWGAVDDYAFDAFEGPFGSFAVGWGVLCAVRFDGVVICSASDFDPYPHKPLFDAVTVTAGFGTFCAITTEHEAKCWDELFPKFGVVSPLVAATPPEGPFAELFIGQGDDVACGIRRDRTVACWGDIARIGADDPPGHFVRLAVGVFHACGLRLDGTIACWSDGSYDHDGTPAGEFIDLSVGLFHSCGVRDNGELICWDADTAERLPAPHGTFTDVESLEIENCALRRDGAAVCWQQSF